MNNIRLPNINKIEPKDMIKKTFVRSVQGTNNHGVKKINQDNFITKRCLLGLPGYSIFSVFDGHGNGILN
jgi:hypothetical protein